MTSTAPLMYFTFIHLLYENKVYEIVYTKYLQSTHTHTHTRIIILKHGGSDKIFNY